MPRCRVRRVRYGVTKPPICTTSRARPRTLCRVSSGASSQRASGAPEMYHSLPLQATILPYVLERLEQYAHRRREARHVVVGL
jgi:hypothetical protein